MDTLLEIDRRWSARISFAERSAALRSIGALLAHSGDSWFWGAGLAAVWVLGDAFQKQWAVGLLIGIFVTAVIVMALKFLIRRQRPEGTFGSLYRRTDPHSFPSGHAARSTMLAVLVLGWGPSWLAPILLIWAPLVTLSRVAMDLHYLSDALAGVVLGIMLGIAILLIA
ncbi:MAG: phosphatase PAP2 family protein [Anaerolineae bacterium]|nr:MAG: phosphatase PAP2 family protein [Anaerolineae bacterium]